jgi:cytochrome c peroxidase
VKPFIIVLFISLFVAASCMLESCKKNDAYNGTPFTFEIPAGFPQPQYFFQNNALIKEGIALGRQLFYDGQLSKDGNFSCASCHQQSAAFSTFDHDLSHGYNNSHTLRNAPGLFNLAWYPAYRQDGGISNLEALSLAHINAPKEMGENINNVVDKLSQDARYAELFKAAYGDSKINSDRILKALKQFIIILVSADSKYDKVKKGTTSFTNGEQQGYSIFLAKCNTCHKEPLFTDFSFRNIGLPLVPSLNDYGRMKVTGNTQDSLKFRVPSLRNIELTGYYTHDGSIGSIRGMLNHYRTKVIKSSTLDPALQNGISLTDAETDALILFLKTLTDTSFIKNPRFSQP